jgi:hypothetical protein
LRHKWKNYVKVTPEEIRSENVEWIVLAQNRILCQILRTWKQNLVSTENNEFIDQLSDHNIPGIDISHGNSIITNIWTYVSTESIFRNMEIFSDIYIIPYILGNSER